ncbi:hypothetical protein [Mesoplasma seiffertii]|uniref:hypothetical protein n=1 Tax=Mesoplasma seiffertii TaxID=28224 RepID=UPI0004792D09|nr:hypothetical protein [Mesoplasma seiffertii]
MKLSKKTLKLLLVGVIGLSSVTLTLFSIKYAELFNSKSTSSSKKLEQPYFSKNELAMVLDKNQEFNKTLFKTWFLKKLNLKIYEIEIYFSKKQIVVSFKFQKNKYNWYYKL